ncbi:glycosyltransferase family 4 protein [Bacteroidota bacterium]
MIKKVVLIEPVFAHYRKDVFESFLHSKDFDFNIIAGRNYDGVKSLEAYDNRLYNYITFRLFNHKFYFLKGVIKYLLNEKPDVVICTGIDLHLIHTILIHFIFRLVKRKSFYWWSHASIGNQGNLGMNVRRFFYKKSTGILAYNQEGRENLLKMGISENRIMVVNNSLNRADYGYLNYDLFIAKKNEKFTILYSGRLTKAKKVDVLIKALGIIKQKKLIDFQCYIIGDGDLASLKKLVNKLNLENEVTFLGAKYGKETDPYFIKSSLFVYPGGIGLSILHAMSYGIPVLTTDNLNLHFPEFEILEKGFNGDLFINDSHEDLANKIVKWKEKAVDWEKYAKNCINKIETMGYLPEIMVEKVLSFLKLNEYNENSE